MSRALATAKYLIHIGDYVSRYETRNVEPSNFSRSLLLTSPTTPTGIRTHSESAAKVHRVVRADHEGVARRHEYVFSSGLPLLAVCVISAARASTHQDGRVFDLQQSKVIR